MARRSRSAPAPLRIQVSFETTRISAQCLVDAYNHLVPITRRRLRSAQTRKPSPTEPAAPIMRRGDHA
jgi:hypothetical protein